MEQRRYGQDVTMETRHDSHEKVDKAVRYRQIIEVLKDTSLDGLSAKEIAHKMYLKGYIPTNERNYTAPRLTELCQKGIVEPIGKDICCFTGHKVTYYALREIK